VIGTSGRRVPPHCAGVGATVASLLLGNTARVGAKTAYIERGSPGENGYIESFNARLRDELLNGEIFYTLREAQIVIESWRRHYNTIRPHASIARSSRFSAAQRRRGRSWRARSRPMPVIGFLGSASPDAFADRQRTPSAPCP